MRLVSFCVALLLSLPAMTKAETPTTWGGVSEVEGWEAVGRLTISGRTMCTGALVAPDLVLTAAHCLFDPRTGRQVDPGSVQFQAGLNNGASKAERRVVTASFHPDYRYRAKGQAQVGSDLALLRLNTPIDRRSVTPVGFDQRPEKGDILSVIAYTIGHQTNPRMAYPCKVLARKQETLVMSCEVDFGASGAPVFALHGGRRPYLVSVISAKAAMGGQDVSVGTTLDPQILAQLMAGG